MTEAMKNAIDTLARYVYGHNGCSRSARRLAREIIEAIGYNVTDFSPGAVGCDLAATHLSAEKGPSEKCSARTDGGPCEPAVNNDCDFCGIDLDPVGGR